MGGVTVVKKVIVLELKDNYALAMEEGGNIIRIKQKDGLSVGDKIYVLPEDISQRAQENTIIPFSVNEPRKSQSVKRTSNTKLWNRLIGVAAMFAIVITLLLPQMSLTACAEASFDGSAGIQIELDRYGRILNAVSPDNSVSDESLFVLKGKNIKDVEAEIYALCGSESILIGYANLNVDDKDDRLVRIIQSLFPGQPVVYLQGNPDDIHMAETKSISLGKYLMEQKKADELEEILSALPKEKIEQLLQENPKWIDEDLREILEEHKEHLEDYDDGNDVDDDKTESSEHFEEAEETDEPDIPDESEETEKSDIPDESEETEKPDMPDETEDAKAQELLENQEDPDIEEPQNDDLEGESANNIDDEDVDENE